MVKTRRWFICDDAHPPARKFNAGQKIIFWAVMLGGLSISLSGWALLFPFETKMMAKTLVFLIWSVLICLQI